MRNLILLIGLVVLTSGCLHGNETVSASSNGLNIVDFSPDISAIEENDRFSLILEVQNTGGAEATDVYALLHGISLAGSSDSFDIEGDALVSLGDISGPNEASGIQGERDVVDWTLQAPDLPSGFEVTHDPRVRVMYGYQTFATTSIVALSGDEYDRLRRQGETIPSQKGGVVSKGPLSVSITLVQDPVVIRNDDDNIDLIIEIRKNSPGTVFDPSDDDYMDDGEIDSTDLHMVGVTIDASGVDAGEGRCEGFESESKERMIRGAELRINCELSTDRFVGVKEIPVRVDVRYNYLVDASTKLTVSGQ